MPFAQNETQISANTDKTPVSPAADVEYLSNVTTPQTTPSEATILTPDTSSVDQVDVDTLGMNYHWVQEEEFQPAFPSDNFTFDHQPSSFSPVPLPPPPPPPPPPPFSRPEFALKDLGRFQEELRDSRDNLIGSRFRLHTKRNELRNVRHEAGGQAGVAYTLIKRFTLEQGLSLPSPIVEAIAKADESRNNLGNLETEYDQAEDDYNQAEWKYTRMEEDFIESLPGHMETSRVPDYNGIQNLETGYLTQFADASMDILSLRECERPASLNTLQEDLLEQPDSSAIHLEVPGVFELPSMLRDTRSEHGASLRYDLQRPIPRSSSEADLENSHLQWYSTRQRINEWLLDSLARSSFQRQRLHDALSRHGLEDREWFQLVVRYWYLDSPSDPPFHTGDTTVSDSSTDRPLSGFTSTEVPENAFERCSDRGLLFGTLPPVHSPLDLDVTSATVVPVTPEDTPLGFHRGSQKADDSQKTDLLRLDVASGDDHEEGEGEEEACFQPPTSGSRQGDTENRDSEIISPELACSTAYPSNRAESRNLEAIAMARVDSAFPDTSSVQPIPRSQAPSVATEGPHQSWQLIPNFIQVDGPKPWSLPLVRLTPYTLSTLRSHIQQLDCLPFVSIPDTPFQLPGPSKFLTSF